MTKTLSTELLNKRDQLLEMIRSYDSCAVAFSAGVDSAVVAKAAALALGDRAVAATGVSASLAAGELEEARETAKLIGIRHLEVETRELSQPEYVQNPPDRCYHCRTELHRELTELRRQLDAAVLLDGANADDLHDYRPGTRAASEHHVRSPLADCGFTKADVRELARAWELPIWDKPATPCLSSRVAYGEAVTEERLAMIDRAERVLRDEGFDTCRVRYHRGDLARVEVPAEQIPSLLAEEVRCRLVDHLNQLGFKFVTLDLQGFRSGSLNVLVSQEELIQ
ncbi:MAG: ATP-dependent sacrificial sulfur transferase LarE [Planctomycetota bacterium]